MLQLCSFMPMFFCLQCLPVLAVLPSPSEAQTLCRGYPSFNCIIFT